MYLSDDPLSSGPSRGSSQPCESLTQSLRRKAKIANIMYRIEYLVSYLSATHELLEFVSSDDSIFLLYQRQIITIIELARKTLENSGVTVFLWCPCPQGLEAHKNAYIDQLRMLEKQQKYVASQLARSVQVLLMPLTSRFSRSAQRTPVSPCITVPRLSTTIDVSSGCPVCPSLQQDNPLERQAESSSSLMLPPNEFPATPRQRSPQHVVKPGLRRLWDPNELSYRSLPPRHRSRSRPSHRLRHDSDEVPMDTKLERENVAPEPDTQFRLAPTRQRFGIFLTRKSSMLGNLNRKERNTSLPTH